MDHVHVLAVRGGNAGVDFVDLEGAGRPVRPRRSVLIGNRPAANLRQPLDEVTELAEGDYRVRELVARVDESQNLVSYHLRALRDGVQVATTLPMFFLLLCP